MIIIDDIPQGGSEWFALKAGIPSASHASDILTEKTRKPSKSQIPYMDKLADEAIRGPVEEGYQSKEMETGTERESESRIVWELDHLVEVRQVAFIFDDQKMYGCSPDGLPVVTPPMGLELKNPLGKTQVKRLREKILPEGEGYFAQIQMSLLITGFDLWAFRSWVPGHKPLDLEVTRDEKFIKLLKEQLEKFCFELAGLIKKLKGGIK